jgi:hypothetical protein
MKIILNSIKWWNIDPITLDELLSAPTQFKNKKAPGSDKINI